MFGGKIVLTIQYENPIEIWLRCSETCLTPSTFIKDVRVGVEEASN